MGFLDWFSRRTPPDPEPEEAGLPVPTTAEIEWARREKDALLRRAKMLDIDIDLERLRIPNWER